MLHRLTVILLTVAALLAPAMAAQPSRAESPTKPQRSACCGEHCCCTRECPCVEEGAPSTPVDETLAVPSSARELRLLFVHLPSTVATRMAVPQSGRLDPCVRARASAEPEAGRTLLARVSRWTT